MGQDPVFLSFACFQFFMDGYSSFSPHSRQLQNGKYPGSLHCSVVPSNLEGQLVVVPTPHFFGVDFDVDEDFEVDAGAPGQGPDGATQLLAELLHISCTAY